MQVDEMFYHNPVDAVIHLAAKVGGVKSNTDYVADFFHQNVLINTNLLSAANEYNIEKVVSLLSTCIYPDDATYPLTENQIHNGEPHISNFGYAYAKRMLDIYSRSIRQQYNRNYICAVPNNLYGPYDNFDLHNGHVIPAIIRKVWEAKINNNPFVECWGDGIPLREFTYSEDITKIMLFLLDNYNEATPINIGNMEEHSIEMVVKIICLILEYDGTIQWRTDMPTGQYKKPSSNEKLLNLGWKKEYYTSLQKGLTKTCEWFIMNYPKIRGIDI